MRAAQIDWYGDESVVTVRAAPMPRPAAGELRIRVAASSINPVDIKIRSGAERPVLPMPLTLAGTSPGMSWTDHVVTGAPQPGRYGGVLDTAGTPCPGALRRGGRYVSIVLGTLPELSEADSTAAMSYVEQNGRRLAHLVDLVDKGRLTLRTAATYPLDAIAEAMHAFDRPSNGKIILDLLQGRAG